MSHPASATGSREELVQRLLAGVDEGHDLAASIGTGVVVVLLPSRPSFYSSSDAAAFACRAASARAASRHR